MPTKFRTSQEEGEYEVPTSAPTSTAMKGYSIKGDDKRSKMQSQATEVSEVMGATESSEVESSSVTGFMDDNHTSMSSPFRSTESEDESSESSGSGEEAAGTESEFESVEGWAPPEPTESGEEAEPVVEASFADKETSEGGQEFFGAIAGLLAPMIPTLIKAVAPTVVKAGSKLAGGLISKGVKKIAPQTLSVINRLKALGLNIPPNILGKLETSQDEFGDGSESSMVSESDLETLQRQLDQIEVVIGPDDRVQIMATKEIPWKRICHLKITTKTGKSYLGTGFFVGPRTIVTAAHCVYIHSQGGWAKNIVVSPARNGSETPFNSFTATKFRSVKGWVVNKDRNYDYAAIILDKSAAVSPSIGSFGFGYYSNDFLMNKHLNTAGYPGDKPSGTMWFNGRKAKAISDRVITYDIDTAGGQSGSAVWFKGLDNKRIVVGIHTNGASSGNSATRITKPVFDNIKKWRSEGGDTL
ncbi:MAG TPA: serine protease [Chitinophagaceae bacterium]